jgi:FkbM family methyltransferase
MAATPGLPPYLEQQAVLLARIDTAKAAIDRSLRTSKDPEAATWKLHFDHLYNSLKQQIGWSVDKSRRLRWLERLLHVVPLPFYRESLRSLLNPPFRGDSAIWKTPERFTGYPVDTAHYPTAYGFGITSHGMDHWEYAATSHYARELSETFLVLTMLPLLDQFIDVGANVGFYSLLAATQSSTLRVISCEPSASTFQRLTDSVRRNGLTERITLLQTALGRTLGQATLHARTIGTGGESLIAMADERIAKSQRVAIRTLDDIAEEYKLKGRKTLIKIDVEGFEYEVLAGAQEWRKVSVAPMIFFESWDTAPVAPSRLIKELRADGYTLFAIEPPTGGPVLKTTGSTIPQTTGNFLAVPSWAKTAIEPLLQPTDLRLFSPTDKLHALQTFLDHYLASLTRHEKTAA